VQPAVKKITFQIECDTITNHPFPETQVLTLAKIDGVTNSHVKYARVLTCTVGVFKMCREAQTTPPARVTRLFPVR
jgi:hypothetical protein